MRFNGLPAYRPIRCSTLGRGITILSAVARISRFGDALARQERDGVTAALSASIQRLPRAERCGRRAASRLPLRAVENRRLRRVCLR
jgi:hypothetical protein